MNLFDTNPKIILKTEKSKLILHKNWIPKKESNLIFKYFLSVDFETEEYYFNNQKIISKRKSIAFGNKKLIYTYSGITKQSAIWNNEIEDLAERISRYINNQNPESQNVFNFVLCNLYLNGQAAVGWHSDDESLINQEFPIASLSFGQSRIFEIRKNYKTKNIKEFDLYNLINEENTFSSIQLDDGDLLIMYGDFQYEFQHRIIKDSSKNARINLTFRKIRE